MPTTTPRWSPSSRLWATVEHVWVGLALAGIALASALYPIDPIDYWWTVKLGDLIRQRGALLGAEPLMYTPVRDLAVDGQWLARVVLSTVHAAGGVELASTLRMLVSVAVAGLLLRLCRDAGAGVRASTAAVWLGALLYLPNLAVRPQLLAVVPFMVVLRAALRPPSGGAALLGVGATVVWWANVHGSFVLLYPLLAVGVLDALRRHRGGDGAALRPMLRLAAVCALAPLVNPHGLGLASYVWDALRFNGGGLGIPTLSGEFLPPTFATANGRAFFASATVAIGLLVTGRRPRFAEGLLLLLFGLLALTAVRYALWWSFILVPFAARAVEERAGVLQRAVPWVCRRLDLRCPKTAAPSPSPSQLADRRRARRSRTPRCSSCSPRWWACRCPGSVARRPSRSRTCR